MVVFRKLDVKTDEITMKSNENDQKGVAYVDFVVPIIQDFDTSNIDLLTKLVNYTTIARDFCKAKRKSKLLITSDGLELTMVV